MREVVERISRSSVNSKASRWLPFDFAQESFRNAGTLGDHLSDLGDDIKARAAHLPLVHYPVAMRTAIDLISAASRCYAFSTTSRQATVVGLEAGTTPTPDDAKALWYAHNRESLAARDEWDALVRGDAVKASIKSLEEFNTALTATLLIGDT